MHDPRKPGEHAKVACRDGFDRYSNSLSANSWRVISKCAATSPSMAESVPILSGSWRGDGDVVLTPLCGGQAHMAADLTRDAVAELSERFGELFTGDVTRDFHAAMTSSRTK